MKCLDPIPIMPSVAVVVSERRDRVIASVYNDNFFLFIAVVALHSLYLRTARSRTLQVALLFRTTHYYP